MPTDARRTALATLAALTCLVLAGCSAGPSVPDVDAPAPAAASPTTSVPPGADDRADDRDTGGETTGPGQDAGGDGSTSSTDDQDDDSQNPGIEISVAPEPTEPTEPTEPILSELLEDQSSAPLVPTPLPRAASASNRLVAGFPAVLRPPPASNVESSSVSPAGGRLQVALVGSSSRSATAVLRAFRTRLAGRGMTELGAPAAVGGAQAAAFRRGQSRVTLTVTPGRARTSYIVSAVLHGGQD